MSRVLVALALAAMSAVASALPQVKPPQLTPISVIVFPGGWNLPIWAAERQGFFEQNGLRA